MKPTFWASVVFTIPPLLFLGLGWLEMNLPEWDANDSGAVQGYTIFVFSTLTALLCASMVFPGIAKLLGSRFTSRKWVFLNIAVIILLAFFVSIIFGYFLVGDTSFTGLFVNALVLSLPLAITCFILLAPAMYVWLRLATYTNSKASNSAL
ncbi:hypothetical protein [Marinomonas sp. PE14-40]|uniref:hypothetical protein n=1 Tax=Marinomonas sp. PE14-40 TaxID=3060621 RepID=UPI003F6805DC